MPYDYVRLFRAAAMRVADFRLRHCCCRALPLLIERRFMPPLRLRA